MSGQAIGKAHLAAVLTNRTQREYLFQIEIEWPDSRALLERLAVGLGTCYHTDRELRERLSLMVSNALAAHRAARRAQRDEHARFIAFIAGINAVLRGDEQAAMALALTRTQRRILGANLSVVPDSVFVDSEWFDARQ